METIFIFISVTRKDKQISTYSSAKQIYSLDNISNVIDEVKSVITDVMDKKQWNNGKIDLIQVFDTKTDKVILTIDNTDLSINEFNKLLK